MFTAHTDMYPWLIHILYVAMSYVVFVQNTTVHTENGKFTMKCTLPLQLCVILNKARSQRSEKWVWSHLSQFVDGLILFDLHEPEVLLQ